MSLLQRVTSIDGIDYEPHAPPSKDLRYGSVKSVRRVVSYDVLHEPETESYPAHPQGAVTAYKVSTAQRLGECYLSTSWERMLTQ